MVDRGTLGRLGARTLFATHYHELTDLADTRSGVKNLHVLVREWGEEIVFLHRLEAGRAGRSWGVQVARLAGMPATTITRAKELFERLAVRVEGTGIDHEPTLFDQTPVESAPEEHPIVQKIRHADLDGLSPRKPLSFWPSGKTNLGPILKRTDDRRLAGREAQPPNPQPGPEPHPTQQEIHGELEQHPQWSHFPEVDEVHDPPTHSAR